MPVEQAILLPLTVVVLLLATPITVRRGLPSTGQLSRLLDSLRKSFATPRRPRRVRRVAMRGARPWWE